MTAESRWSRVLPGAQAAAPRSRSAKLERPCTARAAARASAAPSTTGPRRSRRPPSSCPRPAARASQSRSTISSRVRCGRSCERIDAEHGRLDVLVNDIWGAELLFEWNKPVWEHDLEKGLRVLRLAIDTHLITSHFALPLLIRRPGGLVVEMTDGTSRLQRRALSGLDVLRPGQDRRDSPRVRAGRGARATRLHGGGADAGLAALGDHARALRRDRGELARGRDRQPALRGDLGEPALRRPRRRGARRRPRRACAGTAARSRRASSRASTASPTSTARSPTAGATSSRCRRPGCQRIGRLSRRSGSRPPGR